MINNYSEADTRANFIDPQLVQQNWESSHIRREYYFTDGRKLIGNKRGKRLFVDYLLRYNNVKLAIIEAKKASLHPTEGLQQAIDYGKKLNIDFVYSSNGKEIYEFQLSKGKGQYVNKFPTPDELYDRVYNKNKDLKKHLHTIPFLLERFEPRYYQEGAVNSALEHIANGDKRILLTLATGTGKTFIALQIVHKLLQAKWNVDGQDRRPRVLFLADRNVLADQAINTFNHYENDLIKINGDEIRKRNGRVPTNAYIFFAIYQAIAEREDWGGYYKEYPSDFFDLIIIDECHRGSANEEGSWRAILDHFASAVHIGMTATPKRDDNVDTYKYFGKPVYEYSLKDGINDGFLTPYKVKRIRTNIDEYIFTEGDIVIQGEVEQDLYEIKDFERKITLPARTRLIAKSILKHIGRMEKTIVFCANQSHALDLRDAINDFKEVTDPDYCVRITSDEGIIGRRLLELFQDNTKDIPVILTSSKMLTTGVDARNVRNIVLTAPIGSMVEFKQIIGRGTRLYEGKDFFTIIDFVGASNKFYDKDWDGIPEDQIEVEERDIITTEEEYEALEELGGLDSQVEEGQEKENNREEEEASKTPEKLIVELSNGRKLKVIDVETRYIDENGKPLTAKQFLEKLVGDLPHLYQNEEQLRKAWANPETRTELLIQLSELGFDTEQLQAMQKMIASPDTDIFDILAHISFSTDIKTRTDRANDVRKDKYLTVYKNLKAREFLEYVLNVYEQHGIEELGRSKLTDLIRINLGTTKDAKEAFGSTSNIINAYYDLQKQIYKVS